jgi:DNA polymerase-1
MTYLIDGFNLIFRSFYGVPDLVRSDGFPTNAIHGWVKSMGAILDRKDCERLVVCFDGGADEREALWPEYKANRSSMPDALRQQIPVIKELTALMGLPVWEQAGVEADDLIASYAASEAKMERPVVIVSADKDLAQCLGPWVRQLLPPPTANPKAGWVLLDEAGVHAKFGVRVDQIADYLALVGDSSDNIPGLSGVGPKTAVKWLQEFGDLETLIRKANYVTPARFQTPLAASAELLRRNQKLTRLKTDHARDAVKEDAPDLESLLALLGSLEMKNAARDAALRFGPKN